MLQQRYRKGLPVYLACGAGWREHVPGTVVGFTGMRFGRVLVRLDDDCELGQRGEMLFCEHVMVSSLTEPKEDEWLGAN